MENNNIRTMEFIGKDDWSMYVYKCVETGILYKSETLGGNKSDLYSCGNEFDGEPCYPIKGDFEICFIGLIKEPTKEEKFNYMLLSRLQSDCNYYLGNGNRYSPHLWAGNEKEQIEKMKELYNSFSDDKKPEWLTWEQILQYEKKMVSNKDM